jgi:anti-sigma factor RsiW
VNACPELDMLLAAAAEHDADALAHLRSCPDCAALAEEHRQLEKDLFRLADPLPPTNFVQSVMARVALEPAPARVEMRTGLSILALTLMGATLAFVATHGSLGLLGTRAASAVVAWRTLFFAASEALAAVWSTAALPVVVTMVGLILASTLGLRRLAAHRVVEVEVRP